MLVSDLTRWVGYLEHQTPQLLGVYGANVGKGGCTIFAQMIWDAQRVNLMWLPWCSVFVHAVINRPDILGRAHPGCKVLYKRMRKKGLLRSKEYQPVLGDLIFCANNGWIVDHVAVVLRCDGEYVTSIDGNSVDSSGHFESRHGGAVSIRQRRVVDGRIVGYGVIGNIINIKGEV